MHCTEINARLPTGTQYIIDVGTYLDVVEDHPRSMPCIVSIICRGESGEDAHRRCLPSRPTGALRLPFASLSALPASLVLRRDLHPALSPHFNFPSHLSASPIIPHRDITLLPRHSSRVVTRSGLVFYTPLLHRSSSAAKLPSNDVINASLQSWLHTDRVCLATFAATRAPRP